MREHMGLFRGKRIDNGEWVIGYLCRSYYKVEDACICCTATLNFYSVDPDTVGECTGLKDKNGKLIFEGDIVLFKWDKECDYCHFVEFVDGEFLVTPNLALENLWSIRICGENEKFSVIGNIHDNSELLEGGEEA